MQQKSTSACSTTPYTFVLDDESSYLCVFITPFGKYRFKRLPMGFVMSADWAQATMEECLQDLTGEVFCYMDDILRQDMDWKTHLTMIDKMLERLAENGFTVNPEKCYWAAPEVPFIGYNMTPNGPRPLKSRIEPLLAMKPPESLKQLRAFIGMANFYRIFWQHRAHIMAPLTALTKVPRNEFKQHWKEEQDEAFKAIKAVIARETLLAYPDPNQPFDIYTDASDFQLGAVIKQQNQPIAFYSRKLNEAQRKYSTIEKELLSILEVLEKFRDMLWGSEIHIYTDHKNLSSDTADFKSQRVRSWRLLVEDFAPKFFYTPGGQNQEADHLSRYPILARSEEKAELLDDQEVEELLADMFIALPDHAYPLDFESIRAAQQASKELRAVVEADPNIKYHNFNGFELICRLNKNQEPKIYLTPELEQPTIQWYHEMLGHSGMTRLTKTIGTHLYFPDLAKKCNAFVSTCDSCQRYKDPGPGYGELATRQDTANIFDEVAVDLTGPWRVSVRNLGEIEFSCLTCIDTASTLCELARIESRTSQATADRFFQAWLSRYPNPIRCIYDQGGEFTAPEFQSFTCDAQHYTSPNYSQKPTSQRSVRKSSSYYG